MENLKNKIAEVNNNSVVAQSKKGNTISDLILSMSGQIRMALPKNLDYERFTRIALSCLRTNPKLMDVVKTNPQSYLASLMQSVQMGLEPNTPLGQSYIIPYGKEAQFQIGYKGIIDLCHRTGQFKLINAYPVYTEDIFEFEYGLEQKLIHKPSDIPSGDPVYYYAVYKLFNGGEGFAVMSTQKIRNHAQKYSQAVKKGWTSPWTTDFDAMALKTVLKEVLKYAPKSIELNSFITQDETVKHEIKEDMYDSPTIDMDFAKEPAIREPRTAEAQSVTKDNDIRDAQFTEDIKKLKTSKNKAALSGFMLDIRENFDKFKYTAEQKQNILDIKAEVLNNLGE